MDEEKKVYLFDGANFNNWSFRMEVLLEELDLLDCVREEAEKVEDYQVLVTDSDAVRLAKEIKLQDRKKRDVKCKSVLVRNIADSQLEYIKGKQTPRQIWTTLENTFARKGISGQFYLLKKLSAMKFLESGSLQAHLLEFERMVRDLEAAGIKLQESLIVFYLLQTMPNSYGQLVTVLETLAPEQCTLDFVKARLLSESMKRENIEEMRDSMNSMAFAGTGAKPKMKCFYCKKFGHRRVDCPLLQERTAAMQNNRRSFDNESERANVSETAVTFLCSDSKNLSKKCDRNGFKWILDSGASDHMINSCEFLRDVKTLHEPTMIKVASGEIIQSNCKGKVDILAKIGDRQMHYVVDDVLYVPNLKYNLFSIPRVGQLGMEVIFSKNVAVIKRDGHELCTGSRLNRLYELDVEVMKPNNSKALVSQNAMDDAQLWHRRYGHIGKHGLMKVISDEMVRGLALKKEAINTTDGLGSICGPCMEGKQTRQPFQEHKLPRSSRPLELIHSDVCGYMNPTSWNGKRYFVTFMDDFTHFCVVYFICAKSDVLECFQTYIAMAEAHFDSTISRLRCDNGGEYVGQRFMEFCRMKGIQMEFTVPYTPQQNGVSERFNRTILDKARAMIADSNLKKNMWNEAVLTAVYLLNRSPTAALNSDKTPYELWYGHKPDVSRFRIFGSKAYCHIPKEKRSKLEPRSKTSHFVGYGGGGYRLWDGKQIFIARDVVIEEISIKQRHMSNEANNTEDQNVNLHHGQLLGPYTPLAASNHAENVMESIQRPSVMPIANDIDSAESDVEFQQTLPFLPVEIDTGEDTFDDAENNSFNVNQDPLEEEESDLPRRSGRVCKPPAKLDDYLCFAYALNAENFVENIPDSIDELKKLSDWPEWKAGRAGIAC